jgi:cytoskeletal protein RodZ
LMVLVGAMTALVWITLQQHQPGIRKGSPSQKSKNSRRAKASSRGSRSRASKAQSKIKKKSARFRVVSKDEITIVPPAIETESERLASSLHWKNAHRLDIARGRRMAHCS